MTATTVIGSVKYLLEMITYIVGALVFFLGVLYALLMQLEALFPEKMLMFYLKRHNKLLSRHRELNTSPHEVFQKAEAKEKEEYTVASATTSTDYSKENEKVVKEESQSQSLPNDPENPKTSRKSEGSSFDTAHDREDGFNTVPMALQKRAVIESHKARFRNLSAQPQNFTSATSAPEVSTSSSEEAISESEINEHSDNISIESLEKLLNRLAYYGATNDDGYQTGGEVLEAIINDAPISFFTDEEKNMVKENCDLTILLNFAMLSRTQLIRSYADNPNVGQELQ